MTARRRFVGACLTVGVLVFLGPAQRGWAEDASAEALTLLQTGTIEGAATLTSTAATEDDPSVHLNTASILFYKGIGLLRNGNKPDSETIFRSVEHELLTAIRLSEQDANAHRHNLLRGQCAFLLGDVYSFVFSNPTIAKAFYQQSVRYVPDHTAAVEALKRLDAPKAPHP
jgi:hypothetical protein